MVFANGIDENIVGTMVNHKEDASSPTASSPVPLANDTPNPPVLASAVVVPEAESSIPTGPSKRRQSSISSPTNAKRPRLDTSRSFSVSHDAQSGKPSSAQSPPSASPNAAGNRASILGGVGTDEDRRRGKRLFGGLLGTLAQGGSTSRISKKKQDVEEKMLAKQRQQDELERKQRARLKLEDEEKEELKRLKMVELDETRRAEQKAWDEKSLRVQHDHMRATARFLETEASPKLYYKPWDLLPRQAEQIKTQTAEVEKTIMQELPVSGTKRASEAPDTIASQPNGASGADKINTVGTNSQDQTDTAPSVKADVDTNTLDTAVAATGTTNNVAANEATDDRADENDEVVEAGEDTVIY